MEKVIGIDLGTSTLSTAVFEGTSPVVITNSEGRRTTPSMVSFDKNGERKIGDGAKRPMGTRADMSVSAISISLANLAIISEPA